jgi:hypothetical protein
VNPLSEGIGSGAPICPATASVTVSNTGQQTLNWTATATNGLSVAASGSILAGGSASVTIYGPLANPGDGYVYFSSNGGSATVDIYYSCMF